MDSLEIKRRFKTKSYQFIAANLLVLVLLGFALQYSKQWGYYQYTFVPIVIIFLFWIFNADKLYRCPKCKGVPRGKEGLIVIPKSCNACGVELR